MNINHTNKQAIHKALKEDMHQRLFKQHHQHMIENGKLDELGNIDNDLDNALSIMINKILHCNNMNDINELLTEYCDLFTDYDKLNVATTDGTFNYILELFINKINMQNVSAMGKEPGLSNPLPPPKLTSPKK